VLRYAKDSLIVLKCQGLKVLMYRSVHSAGWVLGENPTKLADYQDPNAAVVSSVKVLWPLSSQDNDAVQLAARVLSQGKSQRSDQMDAGFGHEQSLERANELREVLSEVLEPGWHIVFDKNPVAATTLCQRRMMLQRGKYTFIIWQHVEPRPTAMQILTSNLLGLKILGVFVLFVCFAVYKVGCPTATGWKEVMCTTASSNIFYVVAACAMIYVYLRFMASSRRIKMQRRNTAAAR